MKEYLNKIIKKSGNPNAAVVSDGLGGADVTSYTDTGSMMFNAVISGSLFGGVPNNKIIGLAGEQATGKTFFTLGILAKFLKDNPDGVVVYFDSEQAVTTEMFISHGINPEKVAVLPVSTVQEFRTQAFTIVNDYIKDKETRPMFMVLDSLGMLTTNKALQDIEEGKDTRDMTRPQLIKGTFTALTQKLGVAKIPMIVTNHTYEIIGAYVPMKEMGGGMGLKFAASIIVYLSKKKDKDSEGDVVGSIINCSVYKSRFTKENKKASVRLNFESGLDRYYGLVDLALDHGVFVKNGTRITLPDGSNVFEKNIYENPDKYFTKDVLAKLEEAAAKEFKLKSSIDNGS